MIKFKIEGMEIELNDQQISQIREQLAKHDEGTKSVSCRKDLGRIGGYYVKTNSDIGIDNDLSTDTYNRNCRATKEQAEASIAMSQLSQLMKHYNGDRVPDRKDITTLKYNIWFQREEICLTVNKETRAFLSFPTHIIRDKFLSNHRDLIEIAKPLL